MKDPRTEFQTKLDRFLISASLQEQLGAFVALYLVSEYMLDEHQRRLVGHLDVATYALGIQGSVIRAGKRATAYAQTTLGKMQAEHEHEPAEHEPAEHEREV